MTLDLIEDIRKTKEKNGATIIAHNYQVQDVIRVADISGDSFELAVAAMQTEHDPIIFCGVRFMAETAKILNPDKDVLIPVEDAICPMAAQLNPEDIIHWKDENPDGLVALYVNSTTECKAEADVCITSGNARHVVKQLDSDLIAIAPDANLASYIRRVTPKKKIVAIPTNGGCYVHKRFSVEHLDAFPGVPVVVHPECSEELQIKSDYIESTSGMLKLAAKPEIKELVVGTEIGLIDQLREKYPKKNFYPLYNRAYCQNMKKITIYDVYNSLHFHQFEVTIPTNVANRARTCLELMVKLSHKV